MSVLWLCCGCAVTVLSGPCLPREGARSDAKGRQRPGRPVRQDHAGQEEGGRQRPQGVRLGWLVGWLVFIRLDPGHGISVFLPPLRAALLDAPRSWGDVGRAA